MAVTNSEFKKVFMKFEGLFIDCFFMSRSKAEGRGGKKGFYKVPDGGGSEESADQNIGSRVHFL